MKRILIGLALTLLAGLMPAAGSAGWTLRVDQREGLPLLAKDGASAMSGTYVFFGKNWGWAHQSADFKVVAPFEYSVTGKNKLLNFDLVASARRTNARQLIWRFDLHAPETIPDVIGGGIAFKFDLDTFGAELGEPSLLPDNRGWAWGRAGHRIEMRFDPPLAKVYFEPGRKSEIRAFFYKGEVEQGRRQHSATLDLTADMTIGPSEPERYASIDATWTTGMLDWNASPVDLSFLNAAEKPAGKRGFLKAVKDKLVFEDGTVARFWGTNLSAYTLFGTSRENVKAQARRLSQLGFNLVRLHHHDSLWVSPNIFGDSKAADTQTLQSAMLDKLDWWIKCLKDEGIYLWLDLHVERRFKPGDGIENFEEIAKGKPTADLKGYSYVNKSIQQAMKRFNEAYVTHGNNYTGLRYKDDPAIVAMLITNENDLTHHFGNVLLPDKKVPKHNAWYAQKADAFAAAHGLPRDKTWRSWEHGPSKLFLNDLERQFNAEMISHLRSLGVRAPLVTTSSWGYAPLSSLPALSVGDMIDAHAYGGHGELERSPLLKPNLTHWIAAAHLVGRPLTATEWNVENFPVPDRHTIPLYMASFAAHQGWDALLQYAYSQEAIGGYSMASNWHAYNDPSLLAMLPAAALLYRQGHVREASTTYAFVPSREQLFNQPISPDNSVALRTAAELGRLVIVLPPARELPWLEKASVPAGARVVTDPRQSLIPASAREVTSGTGELYRSWELGIYSVDTPRTQAAMGWIGGQRILLKDVEIEIATHNASVSVQSLDGKPVSESGELLISLGAQSVPAKGRHLPYISEPVLGRLKIRASKGLKLYKASAAGEQRLLPAPYQSGRYTIELDATLQTYWLRLSRGDVGKLAATMPANLPRRIEGAGTK